MLVALKYVTAPKKKGMNTRRCNKKTIIMYRMYKMTSLLTHNKERRAYNEVEKIKIHKSL